MPHTIGPWIVSAETHRAYGRTLAYVPEESLTGLKERHIVAPAAPLPTHAKRHNTVKRDGKANAMLIAAAPDLLSACLAALPELRSTLESFPEGPDGGLGDVIALVEAAIAKATKE